MNNIVSIDMIKSIAEAWVPLPKASSALPPYQGSIRPSLVLKQSPQPETAEGIAKLKNALEYLDPSSTRGNGKIFEMDGKPAESYWLGVVWAIASLGWPSGEHIAREWSKQSDLYTDEGFEAAWEGYDPNHANPIGIGSLYKRAMENGWDALKNNSTATTPTPLSLPRNFVFQ